MVLLVVFLGLTLSRKSYKLGLKALWRISDDGCLPARIVDYLERGHMQQPRGCQFLEKQSRNHVLGLARHEVFTKSGVDRN